MSDNTPPKVSALEEETKSTSEEKNDSLVEANTSFSAGIDALASFISDKLRISTDPTDNVLENPTVEAVVSYIKSGRCKNVITLVGAGISTAAGIPDFRSPGSGLYANLQKYDLTHPEDIFCLDYFNRNPRPFFELAKELYPGSFFPTKSHYFIKLLENKGLLLRHYTQNIDTLERIAGIDLEKLVEAHGTFHVGHCLRCRKEYSQDWMKDQIFQDKTPKCLKCMGVVKPDIVFFGEDLPARFYKCVHLDFRKCDLLIVMGSSLTVQPVASLVDRVKKTCPRLLINREKAGDMIFNHPKNVRNVKMLGDCDEQCQLLADALDWGEELKELHKTEHLRLQQASNKTFELKHVKDTASQSN